MIPEFHLLWIYYLLWVKCSYLSAVETKRSSIIEVGSERTSELKDWEECSVMLYSRHGMTTTLRSSQNLCLHAEGLHKIKVLKNYGLYGWGWGSHHLLAEEPMADDGCWGMKNLFYLARVVTGRWPMFQWMFPYPWAYGQHYLASVGY